MPTAPDSDLFPQLLDATIRHLEMLKSQGVRFLPVDAQTLRRLRGGTPALPAGGAVSRSPIPVPPRSAAPAAPSVESQPAQPQFATAASPAAGSASSAVTLGSPGKIQAMQELRERA